MSMLLKGAIETFVPAVPGRPGQAASTTCPPTVTPPTIPPRPQPGGGGGSGPTPWPGNIRPPPDPCAGRPQFCQPVPGQTGSFAPMQCFCT